jgi:uncharacterized protein with von Willebrand factor type A (vWA) domain
MESDDRILGFCRFLREEGFGVGVQQTLDAITAVRICQPRNGEALSATLRPVLCASREEWERFPELLDLFESGKRRRSAPQRERAEQRLWTLAGGDAGSSGTGDREAKQVSGASLAERRRSVDFSKIPHGDQAALERFADRLMKRASRRISRRLEAAGRPQQVDIRRSIRRSIGRGGEPVELQHKGRKRQAPPLAILIDVSGSMSLYSFFLLRFAHALQKYFRRTRSFVFSTRLVEITDALRSDRLPDALRALAQAEAGWTGGTRIGDSLREFNARYCRRTTASRTLFVILSDGWDTGEPDVLERELAAIQARVRRVIWLNPLLGLEDYQPITRGMAAALRYVDVFAPAHSLDSLLDLEKHLR